MDYRPVPTGPSDSQSPSTLGSSSLPAWCYLRRTLKATVTLCVVLKRTILVETRQGSAQTASLGHDATPVRTGCDPVQVECKAARMCTRSCASCREMGRVVGMSVQLCSSAPAMVLISQLLSCLELQPIVPRPVHFQRSLINHVVFPSTSWGQHTSKNIFPTMYAPPVTHLETPG